MKPGKDYKISKETKRTLVGMLKGERKSVFKKLMIEAEVFEKHAKASRMKERSTGDNTGE